MSTLTASFTRMEICETSWNAGFLWYSLDYVLLSLFTVPMIYSSHLNGDTHHSFTNKRGKPQILPLIIPFFLWNLDFLVSYSSNLTFVSTFSFMWLFDLWFLDPGSFPDTDYIKPAQKKDQNLPSTISLVSKRGLGGTRCQFLLSTHFSITVDLVFSISITSQLKTNGS